MDKKTRDKLIEISSNASKDKMGDLIREEDIYEEEREKTKRILDKHGSKIPDDVRKRMRKAIEGKAMNRKRQKIDEKVAKEIEEDIEREVKRAIKKGKIDPADPKKDKFLRKMINEQK